MIKQFRFGSPVPIYFGENCVKNNGGVFKGSGNKGFIITSKFIAGYKNLALAETEEALKSENIEYAVNDEVIENPTVENVAHITEAVRKFNPDFIVAVGGGSVIDAAKAVSCLLPHEGEDPYKVFFGEWVSYGSTKNECSIPVFSIPTTAGTGAEVTGNAVLTRADTDTKLTTAQFLVSEAAFLDARYIKESPYFLLDTGAMDALAHGMETYVNVKSSYLNRAVAEIGFKLFSEFKDKLLNKTMDGEDYERMMLASTVQGMAFMQAGTTLPHGMSYPLSHHKGVNHGLGCAIFLGEYIRSFKDRSIVQPIVEMCGFRTVEEFAEYVKTITNRDVNIEVSEKELSDWADEFASLDFRLARHPEPINRDEIYRIYRDSLADYIK
ncbi:iron-containing alcohol dehydrogenase [Sedimentibacter hydroxybenzoicus DSM 7310]|uniref:Iron-containing alcohol dehydrogenase n=1 Tax=Sedimentibacter hydroxybenzoicus DSM 7310 TaxID=1123245 RepID=A0A974BGY9_SEDHY|nr:iron-containing alcohol dehydrogenase [Sedimentibacter hydroxybenzoicus]NYB72963.1 iron-containing alcohol dehydrogenase [Sedimentibacter hydroxybenzoicus DSM 7310]